jgi:hypothetical protein
MSVICGTQHRQEGGQGSGRGLFRKMTNILPEESEENSEANYLG